MVCSACALTYCKQCKFDSSSGHFPPLLSSSPLFPVVASLSCIIKGQKHRNNCLKSMKHRNIFSQQHQATCSAQWRNSFCYVVELDIRSMWLLCINGFNPLAQQCLINLRGANIDAASDGDTKGGYLEQGCEGHEQYFKLAV